MSVVIRSVRSFVFQTFFLVRVLYVSALPALAFVGEGITPFTPPPLYATHYFRRSNQREWNKNCKVNRKCTVTSVGRTHCVPCRYNCFLSLALSFSLLLVICLSFSLVISLSFSLFLSLTLSLFLSY